VLSNRTRCPSPPFRLFGVGVGAAEEVFLLPPPSSSPLFLLVEQLVKAEEIDLSVTKDISDRNVL